MILFIEQSTGWTLLAFAMGMIAFLTLYPLVRGHIFLFLMMITTMVPVVLIAAVLHRFILVEPPLPEGAVLPLTLIGAVAGVGTYYLAIIMYSLDELRKEQEAKRRV